MNRREFLQAIPAVAAGAALASLEQSKAAEAGALVWGPETHFQTEAGGETVLGEVCQYIVFQTWDGADACKTVHGIVAPGTALKLPAPFRGAWWTVTGDLGAIVTRFKEMRQEVVSRDKLENCPPCMVWVAAVPQGFENCPSAAGWKVESIS